MKCFKHNKSICFENFETSEVFLNSEILSLLDTYQNCVAEFEYCLLNYPDFKKYLFKPKLDENRALVKIKSILKLCDPPKIGVIDFGAAPGYVTQFMANLFNVPICAFSLLNSLNKDQKKFFNNICKEKNVIKIIGNMFCPDCLNFDFDFDLIVCDIGDDLDYKLYLKNYFLHLETIEKFKCKTKIVKIQKFGIGFDGFLFSKINGLFLKPFGSWYGNDEVYVLIKEGVTNQQSINSLKNVLNCMINFRKSCVNDYYCENMGIRLFMKLISCSKIEIKDGYTISVDMSCLFYKFGYSLIYAGSQQEEYVFSDEKQSINLLTVIFHILQYIKKIYKENECCINFCFDGNQRPLMKKSEIEKRIKNKSESGSFLRKALNEGKPKLVEIINNLCPKIKMIKSFTIETAQGEADLILLKSDIIITTDTDLALMSVFTDNVKFVSFCKTFNNSFNMCVDEYRPFKKALFFTSVFVGNDYLPTIYSTVKIEELFEMFKTANDIKECFEMIAPKLKNSQVFIDNHEKIVQSWKTAVYNYEMYITKQDSNFLNYSDSSYNDIKKVPIENVLQLIK